MADFLAEAGIVLDGGQERGRDGDGGYAQPEDSRDRMMRLLNAWRTEANAPEILQYDENLVEGIKSALKEQTEQLDNMFDEVDDEEREKRHFTSTLYHMEMERVRYSLVRYLRTRLLKIQESLEYILNSPVMLERLSFAERSIFATKLNALNNRHWEDNFLGRLREMPGDVTSTLVTSNDRIRHAEPLMNEFVFIMALEDLEEIIMDDNSSTDGWLRRGEVWAARYSRVHREVVNGNIVLL